ncbi:hypothetical protein QYE76_056905 [Lolium multiflorum]|uniref:Retrotransposon gag domain-containing protein n=1 Tax=Lolium multiflorum TaxID=4521 RepID=A0AAD8T2J2_LOLMU|nr:hypothetical protein QYE76_056905 [Lolium multiflorum]
MDACAYLEEPIIMTFGEFRFGVNKEGSYRLEVPISSEFSAIDSNFSSSDEEFSSPYFVDNKASGKLAKIFSNTSFESSADSFISSDSDSIDSFNFIDKSVAIEKVFTTLYNGVTNPDKNQYAKYHQIYAIEEAGRSEPETSEAFDDLGNPYIDPADLRKGLGTKYAGTSTRAQVQLPQAAWDRAARAMDGSEPMTTTATVQELQAYQYRLARESAGKFPPGGEIDAIAIVIERDIISIIIIIISTIYTAITTAAPRHRCNNSGISMNEVRKKLFTISLSGKAAHWYKLLKNGDSIDWEDIVPLFYSKFYPPSEIHKDRNRIYNFWPHDGESIAQAWGRLKSLMLKCPIHELPGNVIIDNFYARLSFQDKTLLDTSCSGSFTRKNEEFKRDLLDRIQENTEGWENDKDRESGIIYDYKCIEAFMDTDKFRNMSATYGLDSQVVANLYKAFASHYELPKKNFDKYHEPYKDKVDSSVNKCVVIETVDNVIPEGYIEKTPFPAKMKEYSVISSAVNKSEKKPKEPEEQIKIEPAVAIVKDLMTENVEDGHIIFCEDASNIVSHPNKSKQVSVPMLSVRIGDHCYYGLCDIGASVSAIPYELYTEIMHEIGSCELEDIDVVIHLANRETISPIGIVRDVEVLCEVFMDDFSVYGNSFDNCLRNLDKVLQRCEETNLVLNWEKCHFMVNEGIVLGHKISERGIEVDRAKVEAIEKMPYPRDVKDRKGADNPVADNLSRLENIAYDPVPVNDSFPNEQLAVIKVSSRESPCTMASNNKDKEPLKENIQDPELKKEDAREDEEEVEEAPQEHQQATVASIGVISNPSNIKRSARIATGGAVPRHYLAPRTSSPSHYNPYRNLIYDRQTERTPKVVLPSNWDINRSDNAGEMKSEAEGWGNNSKSWDSPPDMIMSRVEHNSEMIRNLTYEIEGLQELVRKLVEKNPSPSSPKE